MINQNQSYRTFQGSLLVCILLCATTVIAGCMSDTTPPVMLTYTRSGGIAGFSDHLTVYENGTVLVTRNAGQGSCSLDRDELIALERMFGQAGFASLADTYPAPVPGADYFSYRITYRGRTVTTETTGVPDSLSPVIIALDELLLRCGVLP